MELARLLCLATVLMLAWAFPSWAIDQAGQCRTAVFAEAYPQAIEACTAAVPAADAYLHRGVAYLRSDQPALALADFQAAMVQTAPDYRLYYNQGLALSLLGETQEAVAAFDHALALTAEPAAQADIWIDRGIALQQQAQALPQPEGTAAIHLAMVFDRPAAIANFSTALSLDPSNSRAYYNRGWLYMVQHQPAAAEADFDQVIALGAAAADIYRDRALSRYAQGKRRGAQADLLRAARHSLSAHDYQTYHEIAVLLLALPLEVTA